MLHHCLPLHHLCYCIYNLICRDVSCIPYRRSIIQFLAKCLTESPCDFFCTPILLEVKLVQDTAFFMEPCSFLSSDGCWSKQYSRFTYSNPENIFGSILASNHQKLIVYSVAVGYTSRFLQIFFYNVLSTPVDLKWTLTSNTINRVHDLPITKANQCWKNVKFPARIIIN